MTDFRWFGGIDFSGAREPLSNLWAAVGETRDGRLHVRALRPLPFRADLAAYVSGGWRDDVQGAADGGRALWGADFPFGLPTEAARDVPGAPDGWDALCAWVADRPADEVRETLAAHGKARRATDTGGAMAPLDLRLHKQTVEGMRWIHGLREAGGVSVVPQAVEPGAPVTLVEVYPSATHKGLGLRCGNKPRRAGEIRARPTALRTFVTFEEKAAEAVAVGIEDAWDAVLACLTAWMVRDDLAQPERVAQAPEETVALEGWIFHPPATLG